MIVEFYEGVDGDHRWRLKARNGRIMADSAEGYTTHSKSVLAWRKIQKKLGFTDYNIRYTYKY